MPIDSFLDQAWGGRPAVWQTSRFRIDLGRPRVMGIVNVTPDSFSDGGRYAQADAARAHCDRLGIEQPSRVARRNAGPSGSYRDHYTPAMRDRVAGLFAADIDEFGYEF